NLLLAHQGAEARPVVKLIDLGLARPVGEGELAGTIDYLAPERGEGGPIDCRSDLYSLGCTAYHLLAGREPFPGGTWRETLVRHATEEAGIWRSMRPEVPAHLAAVVARLMERGPERRYRDAEALLADLEPRRRALPARPAAVRRGGWRRLLVRGLVAVLLGVCAGGAVRTMLPSVGLTRAGVESPGLVVCGPETEVIGLPS